MVDTLGEIQEFVLALDDFLQYGTGDIGEVQKTGNLDEGQVMFIGLFQQFHADFRQVETSGDHDPGQFPPYPVCPIVQIVQMGRQKIGIFGE